VTRVVVAFLRRDWSVERSYRLALALGALDTAVFAVGLYFIGALVTDPDVLGSDLQGGYFDFVVIGIALNTFLGVGLGGLGAGLTREQATGTIDLLLASPVEAIWLICGMLAMPFVLATAEVCLLLGLGLGLAGGGINVGGLALAVPVVALTVASFVAVGIAAAGVIVVVKRGDPLTGPFYQVSMLLSGAVFPVDVLPGWLQGLAVLLPATWGIDATRELVLGDAGLVDVLPAIVVLAGFAVVLLPVSIASFGACLRIARNHGMLGAY
jgi:ABC-2 type transport system permease protein